MTLDVRLPDTHDPVTREKWSCSGHGEAAEDEDAGGDPVRQNGQHRCICTGAWTGHDCGTPPAGTDSAATDTVIGGVDDRLLAAASILLLGVAAVLVTTRVWLCRLKHRPVDVGVTQDEVLASLGLTATTDIGAGELGIGLLFDAVLGHSADGWAQFKADLALQPGRGAPQGGAADQAGAAAAAAGAAAARPQDHHRRPGDQPGARGHAQGHVHRARGGRRRAPCRQGAKAGKGALVYGAGRRHVIDASVAVPRRVPREIPRGALTRLKLLGEGTFGEVHRHQLDERSS